MNETINDPTFGTLVFNEQLDSYEATVQTATDGEVSLTISSEAFDDNDFTALRESLPLLLDALPEAKAFVTDDLLEIKNSDWLNEDQEPLSHDEFSQELQLEGLNAHAEQQWQVWFSPNELLFGHHISVWWSQANGFFEAQAG